MEKKCFKCSEVKDLCEFYPHKGMVDGHLGKCKECTKMDVIKHRNRNLDRIREYDRARGKLPHRVKANTERNRKQRKRCPLMYAAHILLNNAIRSGRVTKSEVCIACGSKDRLHGHHRDYHKPLEVLWLCPICHKIQHKAETKRRNHGR